MRIANRRTSLVLAAITLVACGYSDAVQPPPPSIASLVVTPTSLELGANQAEHLTATAYDSSHREVVPTGLVWSSDRPDVVLVNEDGDIYARTPGVAHVAAQVGSFMAWCTVDVGGAGKPAVMAIVSGNGQVLPAGNVPPLTLTVRVTNAAGVPLSATAVSWTAGWNSGSPSSPTSVTNGDGLASIVWTLSGVIGTETMQAGAGNGADVTFAATVR